MFVRVLLIILLIAVLFSTYVRVSGVDPRNWHVDPETENFAAGQGFQLHTAESPRWSESAQEVMQALSDVATETPRTSVLSGRPADAHITFETRSLVWGFPDYTTVKAVEVEGTTVLAILARLKYGSNDLGVNEARVQGWLDELTERLPPQP